MVKLDRGYHKPQVQRCLLCIYLRWEPSGLYEVSIGFTLPPFTMGRYKNPLHNPVHYATPQPLSGPPATAATAQRTTEGYDYVIVGAGAAGCVLASELSRDIDTTVLLLEAGGDNTKVFETKIPLMFPRLFHTEHDWDYYTVQQEGLGDRRLYWPRGRVLGGSSSLNAMMYHHCSKSDFDEWVSEYGCKGWSYDDLAPYFRRMENFTPNPARPRIDIQHRGRDGPWQTGYSHLSEIAEKGFLPACNEVGIPPNPDINTPNGSLGATRFQSFIDPKGQRSSLATAYLNPEILRRPNLYVACNARVTRVLFDRLTSREPTAIGAEFQIKQGGDLFQVHARKEVIVSGGSINTPQTLMLSGIGPADELKKHGIPVVQENQAVGRNLKDHLAATGIICKAKAGVTLDYLGSDIRALPSLARWMLTGGGPLTSNVGESAAFIRSFEHHFPGHEPPKDNTSGSTGPDVEIVGAPIGYIHHGEEPAAEAAFTFGALGLRPKSTGRITLQSRSVFEPRTSSLFPLIHKSSQTDRHSNNRPQIPDRRNKQRHSGPSSRAAGLSAHHAKPQAPKIPGPCPRQ